MKHIKLNTGTSIPAIGFGTWQIFPSLRAKKAVLSALETGYRLIDTARIYGNEAGVGRAIYQSGVARKDIFLTTKLWNTSQGHEQALTGFTSSLKRLEQEYVDLYLIHWPVAGKRLESWRALEEIYASGRAKAIGVSNFTVRHLKELQQHSHIVPTVNQVEFHPFLYKEQVELLDYCKAQGIVIEAYSPLAHGAKTDQTTLPVIAQNYDKSIAQIILRWCIQHDAIPIPKSTNSDHIRDNLDIFDFELSSKEMLAIDQLSDGTRICGNPNDMK